MGQETSLQDWLGNTTTFGYDGAGRLYTTTLPNGITESTVYDADSKVSSVTDAQGTTSVANFNYTYPVPRNADEELMSETDAGTPRARHTDLRARHTPARQRRQQLHLHLRQPVSADQGPGGSAQYFDPSGELCWSAPTMPRAAAQALPAARPATASTPTATALRRHRARRPRPTAGTSTPS